MTLDPQARALLEQLKEQGNKDFSEMSVDDARNFMAAFIQLEGPDLALAQISDRTVPGPHGRHIPVRIYRPQSSTQQPVIVYFHGGGFVLGDIEIADKPCRQLAKATNCVVVSVEYSLAPEHKAPAAVEDCYAAVAWVAQHATELGGDATRLAVAGDSAGGNLAAVVALMARDRGTPALRMQILIYPITQLGSELGRDYPSRITNGEGYLLTQRGMRWLEQHYLINQQQAEDPYISPILAASLDGLPRAVVITAGHDPLRDEGDAYAGHLQQAGVPVLHLRNPSMIHGFMWMSGAIDHTATVYESLGNHVRQHL